jgi:hypothetical protein
MQTAAAIFSALIFLLAGETSIHDHLVAKVVTPPVVADKYGASYDPETPDGASGR